MTSSVSNPFVDGSVVKSAGSAVIYGAGSVGHDVFGLLSGEGITIRCILDRRAAPGQSHAGVPIFSLESCPLDRRERADIPLVIGIFNRDVNIPEVARSLRDAGFTKIVSFVGLHAEFPDRLGDRFWLTTRAFLDTQRADIARAERLFEDERSLTLYRSLIALRRTGEYASEMNPQAGEKNYLPLDVPDWPARRPVRLVDCGAYRGDTIQDLLDAGLAIEASAHFEPDLDNFAALAAVLRERGADGSTTALAWPCAVGDRTRFVAFSHGLGEGSRISAAASGSTIAVVLDDILGGWRPSLIKMDIEGSEIEALVGARRLIAANRPSLAVCVYHRPDHLWRIPLLVSSWHEPGSYRYYLRTHAFDGFELVFYANPREVQS